MGTLHEDQYTFVTIPRSVLRIMRSVSDKVVEKPKTHILCSIFFSRKLWSLWDNEEKYCRTGQATDNMAHAHCMLDN